LGWACGFADFDNDGDGDLWTANGHVYPNAGALGTTSYFQPVVLFENRSARFWPMPLDSTSVTAQSYRGGCFGDFNDDGRIDIAVLPVDGKPLLLENRSQTRDAWIGFRLRGGRSNRDGLGARVEIQSCGKKQFETLRNGDSYLSHNDPRIHFGLGTCGQIDVATIRWPSGGVQRMTDLAVNRYVTVEEGQ
jgi:enediyne biosynthesis protein E4